MWERYCRGVSAILFIVDSADLACVEASRTELHALLDKPQLAGIPLLVLGNKNDLPGALKVGELIEKLCVAASPALEDGSELIDFRWRDRDLSKVSGRECSIYSISAKEARNIDVTMKWIIKRT